MSVSRSEEIIATLWLIAALLCFNGGHPVWGWILLIKSITDVGCAIGTGFNEAIKARRKRYGQN